MPNAKDLTDSQLGKPKFLLTGGIGSGKTTQALTIPGKTFAYFFDPSALSAVRGFDLEYEIFVPQATSLSVRSLTKGRGDPVDPSKIDAHDVYVRWEKDFEERAASGFFADIDTILFDSFTTFSDVVMDRVLHINSRTGQWPQQDDWTAQMNAIRNVVRTLTGQMEITLICTGHEMPMQDDLTKRIFNDIILTGQLKRKLPLLFSDVWHLESVTDQSGVTKYLAQTKPDRENPSCRTSFRDLDPKHDVTIENWNTPHNYGIGKILRDHNLIKLKGE